MTDINIELTRTQMQFVNCADRFSAFIGGVGSGKTFAGCVKDIVHASIPGSLGIVIAPTYPMLKDATLRTFQGIAGDAIQSFNKSDMTMTIKGGGEILFRSADNPDRLRGPNLHWAHMDEGAMCPSGTFDIVIGRLRADGKAGKLWLTTTPNGRNWLYRRREEMRLFKASTTENPYLSREFVESLERSYTGEFAKQELYGEFITLEGLVYDGFREDIHIIDRDPSEMRYWALTCDEGYTNPAVILLIGVDSDSRLHVYREFYQRGVLQDRVVEKAIDFRTSYRLSVVTVDASAAGLIAEMLDRGLPAEPAKGRVLDGISAVQSMLVVQGDGHPRLTVDPSCANTINEFESYVWKDGKDEPVKDNDHALDAIRYFINWLYEEKEIVRIGYEPVQIGNY